MTRWRLGALLGVRSREESSARARLAAALAAEAERRAERERCAEALRASSSQAAAASLGCAEAACGAGLRRAGRFLARLRAEAHALRGSLQGCEARLDVAREAADGAREQLRRASSAVRALERHRERWLAAERRRHEAREDGAAEDLVSGCRAGW